MRRILFIFLVFISANVHGQTRYLETGDTLYRYSTSYIEPIESLYDLDVSSYHFPCVERLVVTSSSVPHVDFSLRSAYDYTELLAIKDEVLVFKGLEGSDPFFNLPGTYMQYIGGIPLSSLEDYEDFDMEGKASFYLDYKAEALPDNLQFWMVFGEYSKLRIRVEIEYSTNFVSKREYDLFDEYETHTEYTMTPVEFSLKKKRWERVELPNELIQEHLLPREVEYRNLIREGRNYETIRVYENPERKIVFQYNKPVTRAADCTYAGRQLYLYPNPTYDDVNILYANLEIGTYDFSLYNIVGKSLWATKLGIQSSSGEVKIDLPPLAKGIYLYAIKNSMGQHIESKRLIVVEP